MLLLSSGGVFFFLLLIEEALISISPVVVRNWPDWFSYPNYILSPSSLNTLGSSSSENTHIFLVLGSEALFDFLLLSCSTFYFNAEVVSLGQSE